MSNGWKDLNTNLFKLMDFNWRTIKPDGTGGSGLYSGDDVIIRINYVINAYSVMLLSPYIVKIHGQLNGQVCTWTASLGSGRESGRQNVDLKFSGKMPVGKDLAGTLVFEGYPATIWGLIIGRGVPFAEAPITIPNLDDALPPEPPDGIPPAVCTEGQERCEGFDLYVCKNSQWIVKEYNSPECGYTPEPICTNGDERCVGTKLQVCVGDHWEIRERNSPRCGYVPPDEDPPVPPIDEEEEGIGAWFERNKTIIIVVSAIVLAIAIGVTVWKTKLRSPVAARPKFQKPIVRR